MRPHMCTQMVISQSSNSWKVHGNIIGIQVVDGMTVFNENNMFLLQYMMCHSIFTRIMKSVRMYREGGRV